MADKQVESSHYAFSRYMDQRRWASIWHQLDEVLSLHPDKVLEIGAGAGVFKQVAGCYGVSVESLDLDPELKPDHIGSADELPFSDDEYDVVCAFQMLEHLPYEVSLRAFREMCRVARRKVVISLPDALTLWPFSFYLPKFGQVWFFLPRPVLGRKPHHFDGQHHWEINKKGFPVSRIVGDFTEAGSVRLEKTYRVPRFPYHRFLIFS
ncbi:hypothetical protein ASALC70_04058 [Alcanivorax sp. ALC70]|nr:class I SAM-dependent methyltransferase [Alcanivorax sp. ZXX171]UWN51823.1 hypothetical protein ASALC70_04058 [Alcanivorax sp. ALC70]